MSLFLAVRLSAQTGFPGYPRRIGEPGYVRVDSTDVWPNNVTLRVAINAQGRVVEAHAIRGVSEAFKAAEELERKRRFKPIDRNGRPVSSSFEDDVEVVPRERWAAQRKPFPEIRDMNSLRMRLERRSCETVCPYFDVEVHGDGRVEFFGHPGAMIEGRHIAHISQQAVRELLTAFEAADYFSLIDKYAYPMTDSRGDLTSIAFDGRSKVVDNYVGLLAGIPDKANRLGEAFDQVAGTTKWLDGNGETVETLRAEGWDFRADSQANKSLMRKAIEYHSVELLDDLVAVPGMAKNVRWCGLEAAVETGNIALARRFFAMGLNSDGAPCSGTTSATLPMKAAASGKAELVREVLKHPPDLFESYLKAKDQLGNNALAYFLSHGPQGVDCGPIARMLISAGVDVNSRDITGETPVFAACGYQPAAIRMLALAGADLNARDKMGETVLVKCKNATGLNALRTAMGTGRK